MGTLDTLKSFSPENITPQGAINNPLSYYEFRKSDNYANPTGFGYIPLANYTPAGIYTNGLEFLQDKWHWPEANTQMVTVPDQPIDKGTFDALKQNSSGVYLQPAYTGTTQSISGRAPVTGVYTGYYSGTGEFEVC